ncbi:hypothetical protein [Methylopila sp. M107]|uniref:hypothetical protein n=1 Tax=Methylopila sp. M107 TaxID=1101190 RepID=UPI000370B329|nr:hypothetical protein [Methylopila sp. M107]
MIQILPIGGAVGRVTTQLIGEDVVVLAFSCQSREAAGRLIAGIERRVGRVAARLRARTPVAEAAPADPFFEGAATRLSTYAWDEGEMSIDVVVLRRVSPTRLIVRTRMGVEREVDQRDLERGRGAS